MHFKRNILLMEIQMRFSTTAQPQPAMELKTISPPPKDLINTTDFFKNKKVTICNMDYCDQPRLYNKSD
jgi:hypothetical protein